jgi:hypothetical protein
METLNNRNQIGWRRLMGWVAAYLLVIHVFFVGVATTHFFPLDTGQGVAFCLSDLDGGSPAGKPPTRSHSQVHCVLCWGGGNLLPASAFFEIDPPAISTAIFAPLSGLSRPFNRTYSPTQPRAPPFEV